MKKFYRLDHHHITNRYMNDVYIGTFESIEMAEKIIDNLITKRGFNNHPRSCFKIQEVILDDFYWKNGFKHESGIDIEIK